MKTSLIICAALLVGFAAAAQETPEEPDVNRVIEDMAAVGPDALLSRVKELKEAEAALKDQAAELRKQAEQKDAEAAAARARIEAVERFTNELATAMAPPKPEEPAAEPPAAPETPAEPAAAEPEAPEPAQVSAETPENSSGMAGEQM